VLSAKSFPFMFFGPSLHSSLHVFRLLFSASLPCTLWVGSVFCLFMKQRREIFLFRLVAKRTNEGQKTGPAFLFPGSRPGSMTPTMGQKYDEPGTEQSAQARNPWDWAGGRGARGERLLPEVKWLGPGVPSSCWAEIQPMLQPVSGTTQARIIRAG